MLEIFCWHWVQLSSLQLKGSTIRLKNSVKNLIWNHPQQLQRFRFSAFTSLLANNILERGWIMCLSFKMASLAGSSVFKFSVYKRLGVNTKWKKTSCKGILVSRYKIWHIFWRQSRPQKKKKKKLQKLIVWVNTLCPMVFLDKICKTLGCIILINSTLEHDMQVST